MRFKIDENLPVEVSTVLERAGHDAETVDEEGLAGESDGQVLERCLEEHRVLVTLDRRFGPLPEKAKRRVAEITSPQELSRLATDLLDDQKGRPFS